MKRRKGLPMLLCWLLCLCGAAYSTGAVWVAWLGRDANSINKLQRVIPLAGQLGLERTPYFLALARMDPAGEEGYLRKALEADGRCFACLTGLALMEEFRGNREKAQELQERAMRLHRSFESYVAGLTQAARWKQWGRVEEISVLALRYCPRDADGVYAQWTGPEMAERILSRGAPGRREDYFRFLLGQQRWDEALRYQQKLGRGDAVDRRREELSEVLFGLGRRAEAAELFAGMHREFRAEGYFNSGLERAPSSQAFDWRLVEHARVKRNWRPGELEFELGAREEPLELMCQYMDPTRRQLTGVLPIWDGEIEGLHWKMEDAGGPWRRVVLVAPAGGERRFRVHGVRYQ